MVCWSLFQIFMGLVRNYEELRECFFCNHRDSHLWHGEIASVAIGPPTVFPSAGSATASRCMQQS